MSKMKLLRIATRQKLKGIKPLEKKNLFFDKHAIGRKKSIIFFNTGDGFELRLKVRNHQHVIGDREICCGLCSQNSRT